MGTVIYSCDYDTSNRDGYNYMGDKSLKENCENNMVCNGSYQSGLCNSCEHYEGRDGCSKYEWFKL